MDAKKFLRDSNLTHYVDGNTEDKVVYEDDVIYLMEKYHQAKVNNVVLDDVSKATCKNCGKSKDKHTEASRMCPNGFNFFEVDC